MKVLDDFTQNPFATLDLKLHRYKCAFFSGSVSSATGEVYLGRSFPEQPTPPHRLQLQESSRENLLCLQKGQWQELHEYDLTPGKQKLVCVTRCFTLHLW